MILIADSGSTKTHWVLADQSGKSTSVYSEGINPFFMDADQIGKTLSDCFADVELDGLEAIYFYGAGCSLPDKCALVAEALRDFFGGPKIEVNSDLLAAARALFGSDKGVACILGTGSNAAVYNGMDFDRRIKSYGYLLGDEGSGSYLGRKLLQDYIREEMPVDLRHLFEAEFKLSHEQILENVYRKSFPNRYLAGFATFASPNLQHPYIKEIVSNSFKDFVRFPLQSLDFDRRLPIGFVGSIAFHFRDLLGTILEENKLIPGPIVRAPIHKLLDFHLNRF